MWRKLVNFERTELLYHLEMVISLTCSSLKVMANWRLWTEKRSAGRGPEVSPRLICIKETNA